MSLNTVSRSTQSPPIGNVGEEELDWMKTTIDTCNNVVASLSCTEASILLKNLSRSDIGCQNDLQYRGNYIPTMSMCFVKMKRYYLRSSCPHGNVEMVEIVLQSVLSDARRSCNVPSLFMKKILQSRAYSGRPSEGYLRAAAAGDILSLVELLNHPEVDRNAQDTKGRTAAHLAVLNGHHKVANYLLEQGFLSLRDFSGKTATDYIWSIVLQKKQFPG